MTDYGRCEAEVSELGDVDGRNGLVARSAPAATNLGDQTLTSTNLGDHTLTSTNLGDQTLTSTNLGDQTPTSTNLGDQTPTESKVSDKGDLIYGIDDRPPGYMCVVLGVQQLLMSLAGALSMSTTLANLICARPSDNIRSVIFSTTLFMSGLCTMLQPAIGVRLPIFQGASNSFLIPLLALKTVDGWQCSAMNTTGLNVTNQNQTSWELEEESYHHESMLWKLRQLQGSLIVASSLQLIVGSTGIIGYMLRFIGPITVVPVITLIGLSLVKVTLIYAPAHWGITALTVGLNIIFVMFLKEYRLPLPACNRKSGFKLLRFPIFKVFPIILSVVLGWLLCYILTVTNVFPKDRHHPNYFARTDVREGLVRSSPWLYLPHPGQYGQPSFSTGAFIGMVAATVASTLESIGDYYSCAKVCYVPPPPTHAINRGIATEAFFSVFSGLLGTAHGTTSYSGNIGAIGITKVASRRVFYVAGLLTLGLSILGKVAAVLVSVPHPVLAGVQMIIFGMLTSLGLSGLQYVSLASSRNLLILGVSLFSGILLPEWISRSPGRIASGNAELDQVITVFLGTPMFIGGILALILDNITPGTLEERGIEAWHSRSSADGGTSTPDTDLALYHLPGCLANRLKKFPITRHLPFLPDYRKPSSQDNVELASLKLNDKGFD